MQTHPQTHRRRALLALAACALARLAPAGAADAPVHHGHDAAHHPAHPAPAGFTRSTAAYVVPDVTLVDAEGVPVPLRRALGETGRPVLLNFIFTTCTAVCPVLSAVFAQVQAGLGRGRDGVRMLSVSIDPEQDTPLALKAYGRSFGAGPQWRMLTGSVADSIAVQRAFDVYRGDKMNHVPAAFVRAAAGGPWVRLEGFASAQDILRELRQLQRG